MKISELIARLEAIRAEHGDLPVAHDCDDNGMCMVDGVEYHAEDRSIFQIHGGGELLTITAPYLSIQGDEETIDVLETDIRSGTGGPP